MPSPRLAALVAALPLCLACQSAFAAQAAPGPDGVAAADFLPPAQRPLELKSGDGQTDNLEHLLGLLAESSGVEFTIDQSTRNQLRQTSTGLAADVTVPAEEAWRWVEGLLVHYGYQLGAVSLRPPYLVGVHFSIPQGGRPFTRPKAIRVAVDDLGLCEAHPAFQYLTVLDLPHVDVRSLGNSLRALTSDPSGSQSIIPVGNSSTLVITGQGTTLSDLAAMLLLIEEHARAAWEQRPAGDSATPGPGVRPTPVPGGPGQASPPGRG
jgi:hypothetical protein